MALKPNISHPFSIYKITNPIGKVYIGLTSNVKRRKAAYKGLECKSQALLYKSINKYGWVNHDFEIIDELICLFKEAKSKEMFWIRSYMCNENKWRMGVGLNLTDGGGGSIGRPLSEEAKLRIGNINNKYRHTEEAKNKIRLSLVGQNRNHKGQSAGVLNKMQEINRNRVYPTGQKQSPETIEKRMVQIRGVKYTGDKLDRLRERVVKSCAVPVIQYDLQGNIVKEYPLVKYAISESGVGRTEIYRVLSGKKKQSKGFIFKYK